MSTITKYTTVTENIFVAQGGATITLPSIKSSEIQTSEADDTIIFTTLPDPNPKFVISSLSAQSLSVKSDSFSPSFINPGEGKVEGTQTGTTTNKGDIDIDASIDSKIDLGSGNNKILAYGEFINSNIKMLGGNDLIEKYAKSPSDTTKALGFTKTTISLGEGNNKIEANYVQESSQILTGSGNDLVSLSYDKSTPLLDSSINLGGGDNTILIQGTKTSLANSVITTGAGSDILTVKGGKDGTAAISDSTIDLGSGTNKIVLEGNIKKSKIFGGPGSDNILGYAEKDTGGVNDSSIELGDGANTIKTVYLNKAEITSGTISGLDVSIIDITNDSKYTSIISSKISLGNASDQIFASSYETNSVDNSKIELGLGDNLVYAINQISNSTVTALGGNNVIEIYANPKTSLASLYSSSVVLGAGNDSVILQNGINYSNITTGDGNDYIEVYEKKNTFTALANSTIDLGSGDDKLFLSAGVVGDSKSTINAGAGKDTLIINKSIAEFNSKEFGSKSGEITLNKQLFVGFENVQFTDAILDLQTKKQLKITASYAPSFKSTDIQIKNIINKLQQTLSKKDLKLSDLDYEFTLTWYKLKNLGSIAKEALSVLSWKNLTAIPGWEGTTLFTGEDLTNIKETEKDQSNKAKYISYNGSSFILENSSSITTSEDNSNSQYKEGVKFGFVLNGIEVFSLEEYSQINWSKVKIGDYSNQQIQQLEWSLIKVGDLSVQELKKIDWNYVNFLSFSKETYSSLDWSAVDFSKLTKEQLKSINTDFLKPEVVNIIQKILSKPTPQTVSPATANSSKVGTSPTNTSDVKSVPSSITDKINKIDWSKQDFSLISSGSKKHLDWAAISTQVSSKFPEQNLSSTDKLQLSLATDKTFKIDYKVFNLNTFNVGELSKGTIAQIDWAQVSFKKLDQPTINNLSIATLLDLNKLTPKHYKEINWSKANLEDFTNESYKAIDWKLVPVSKISSPSTASLNWSKILVEPSFQKASYSKVKWEDVDFSVFGNKAYIETEWSKVNFKKLDIDDYVALDWAMLMSSSKFLPKHYKLIDWGKVDFGDYKPETYQKTDWSKVNFKQFSASSYSSLDWSQVISASGFNAAAYKSVNWGKVDFGDFTQQTFASTNWNQVNFKQLSTSQYQAINWNEINLGALSTKTYKAIDWKKVNVAAFDAESISNAKWSLMKGVSKPTVSAKPAEVDLSFLGVTAPASSTGGLIGADGQSKSNQLIGALTGTKQGQVLPV